MNELKLLRKLKKLKEEKEGMFFSLFT